MVRSPPTSGGRSTSSAGAAPGRDVPGSAEGRVGSLAGVRPNVADRRRPNGAAARAAPVRGSATRRRARAARSRAARREQVERRAERRTEGLAFAIEAGTRDAHPAHEETPKRLAPLLRVMLEDGACWFPVPAPSWPRGDVRELGLEVVPDGYSPRARRSSKSLGRPLARLLRMNAARPRKPTGTSKREPWIRPGHASAKLIPLIAVKTSIR